MNNHVTTHQNNSVHGDDSLLTVVINENITIDAVMDGVTDHGGAEASSAVRDRIESDHPITSNSMQDLLNDLNNVARETFGCSSFPKSTSERHTFVIRLNDRSPKF